MLVLWLGFKVWQFEEKLETFGLKTLVLDIMNLLKSMNLPTLLQLQPSHLDFIYHLVVGLIIGHVIPLHISTCMFLQA
jgi:hypothetical protein